MQDATFFHFYFQLILKDLADRIFIASYSLGHLSVRKNKHILQDV